MNTTHAPLGKTLFAGEYTSRNVGDGIIRLAIEKLCADHGVAAEFRDFFGKPALDHTADAHSAGIAARGAHNHSTPDSPDGSSSLRTSGAPAPAPAQTGVGLKQWLLRSPTVNYAIALLFYATRYRRIAAGYDVRQYQRVVIGGGNLLMDNFLNFPLQILRIVQQCERHKVPVSLFAVGAGKRYSWLCRKIVARIAASPAVTAIVCRDEHSRNLVAQAARPHDATKITAGYDSGLYLARPKNDMHTGTCIDAPANEPTHERSVLRTGHHTDGNIEGGASNAAPQGKLGLGVIAPDVLAALMPDHPMADRSFAVQWWIEVAQALAAREGAHRIEILSNGAPPDNTFAHELGTALERVAPGISVCADIDSPHALIKRISGYQALAAWRMHAAVTAIAMNVPVIAFEWDPKVRELFAYCRQPSACTPLARFHENRPQDVARALLNARPISLEGVRQRLRDDFVRAVLAPASGSQS